MKTAKISHITCNNDGDLLHKELLHTIMDGKVVIKDEYKKI